MGGVAFYGWDSVLGGIIYFLVVFLIGFALGRWSKNKDFTNKEKKE